MTTGTQALARALHDAWPHHVESSGGTGTAPTTNWTVHDPALPSQGLAAAILAALTADDAIALVAELLAAHPERLAEALREAATEHEDLRSTPTAEAHLVIAALRRPRE